MDVSRWLPVAGCDSDFLLGGPPHSGIRARGLLGTDLPRPEPDSDLHRAALATLPLYRTAHRAIEPYTGQSGPGRNRHGGLIDCGPRIVVGGARIPVSPRCSFGFQRRTMDSIQRPRLSTYVRVADQLLAPAARAADRDRRVQQSLVVARHLRAAFLVRSSNRGRDYLQLHSRPAQPECG